MERDYGAGGTTTAATATPSAHSNQAHESAQVTVGVISRAIREMYASGPVAFVRNASLHQKLFLACVVLHLRKSGQNEVSLAEVSH
jgi:Cdc6-like AAA superfamily ATPase